MTTQAMLSGFLAILIGLVTYLAHRLGKKSAQLEAAKEKEKKEEEEKAHAQKVTDAVYSMSADDARRKLQELSNKQR